MLVEIFHPQDLLVALCQILLIDANSIHPKRPRVISISQRLKCVGEVVRDFQLLLFLIRLILI
jgi:hypothetical protein